MQKQYICKFKNQCNKAYSRDGALYYHYINKHDKNSELWPQDTIRPDKPKVRRGRPC